MIVFPNAKINLGLHITGRRPDGFHDIETVFFPIALSDTLEAVHAPAGQDTSITVYGQAVAGPPEDNLCIKAWRLLKKDFPPLPAVDTHLLKNIPMGAGLGGGSADGAFMLQLLNTKFHLGLTSEQLMPYAAQLGSDCPFFVLNRPCYARGRGELLRAIELHLPGWQLLLVHPGIHINTGWAFSQLDPAIFTRPRAPLTDVVEQPVHRWKGQLINDFETPVFKEYPAIKALRDRLYGEGAVYAALSGSGSTVYGLFEKNKPLTPSLTALFRVMNL